MHHRAGTDQGQGEEGDRPAYAGGTGERGRLMAILELAPLGDRRWGHASRPAVPVLDHSVPPVQAAQGGLLQFQLRRLISQILADPDLDPDMHFSLIEHLAQSPGHPEHALLAHLRDVQDPADLPPYKARRKPAVPPGEP